MMIQQGNKVNYGNWVPGKIILHQATIAIICGVLSLFWEVLLVPALFFLLTASYFAYARYLFSPEGGNVQEQVRAIVIEHVQRDGKGKALDIGCGGGALTIKLAQAFPRLTVVGTDSWDRNWEYSQKMCEENARAENVQDRVTFQKASAASLPFPDGHFDIVVSNLVFHEVKETKDKAALIKEALRVLRTGGTFSLQDLFYLERVFGKPEKLVETIKGWGIRHVELVETRNARFIPGALKLPFMLGALGLLKGEK